jgi:3-deoxy-manno-octulosonate cytidylyltransferase (CMP-KDO synthetase)
LLDIGGKAMVHHVVDRARKSLAARIVVATDDTRIQDYCRQADIEVLITSASHPSGTDRIEEVSHKLGLKSGDVVVNVQGDEPLIPPGVINQVADNLDFYPKAGICTLFETMSSFADAINPNMVKVVTDRDGFALSFSRSLLPFPRDEINNPDACDSLALLGTWKRHIGIYAYRVQVLYDFVTWPVGKLERIEKLEQLRAMENGVRIHAEECSCKIPAGVDTNEDLELVRAFFRNKDSA